MNCTVCGGVNPVGATFCGKCGRGMSTSAPAAANQETASKNLILGILIAVTVLVSSVLGFIAYKWLIPMKNANKIIAPLSAVTVKLEAPDLVGMNEKQGREMTEALKLSIEVHTSHSASVASGQIISQSPRKATVVKEGSSIRIVVSTGVEPERSSLPMTAENPPVGERNITNRRLTSREVSSWSYDKTRLELNELYARNGCAFADPALDRYFRSFAWYHPQKGFSSELVAQKFNNVELANQSTLVQHRDKLTMDIGESGSAVSHRTNINANNRSYRDSKAGFQISYPSDWRLSGDKNRIKITSPYSDSVYLVVDISPSPYNTIQEWNATHGEAFWLQFERMVIQKHGEDYVRDQISDTSLDGSEAVRWSYRVMISRNESQIREQTLAFHSRRLFGIWKYAPSHNSPDTFAQLERIKESFRFTR